MFLGRVLALFVLIFLFPQEKSWGQGDVKVWNARPESPTTNELDPVPGEDGAKVEWNEDADVREVEVLRKKAAMDPNAQLGQEIDKNLTDLQSAMNGDISSLSILRDAKMRESLQKIFSNNPLQAVPATLLESSLKKSNFAPVFKKFPFFLKFMTNFMQHPTAFSQLLKVFDRKDALRVSGGISVVLLIILIWIKRKMIKPKMIWWRRFLMSQCFNAIGIMCLLLTYSIIFKDELSPTYQVLGQTLFS